MSTLQAPIPEGLSPRLRGNDAILLTKRIGLGSIPALAGERHTQQPNLRISRVYPRACGGTAERDGF